jgi:tetratricopeptide (TPR) repeat protein
MKEIAVFTLVFAVFCGTARAEDAETRARAAYREGMVFYEKGQYRDAINKLREADDVLRAPPLAFNIAQAYRLMGECGLAVVYYRAYLERDSEAKNKALVE